MIPRNPLANDGIARCRSCQAPIWWRRNPSGRAQPMDYDLVTNSPTDMPHHAMCRSAAEWRRPRGGTEASSLPWWNG
jgi:hypothetical protein